MAEDVHVFEPREAVQWKQDRRLSRAVTGDKNWTGDSAPAGTVISYWLADRADDVSITISDVVTGETFRTLEGTGLAGMNTVRWDLRGDRPQNGGGRGRGGGGGRGGNQGPAAQPGIFRVQVSVDGDDYYTTVRVLEDIWLAR